MPDASSTTSTGGTSAGCSGSALLDFSTMGSSLSADVDATRLRSLAPPDADVQHPVAVGGLDLVRIEVVGERDHAMEAAGEALVEMHAGPLVPRRQGAWALAGDRKHAALDLHVDRPGVQSRRKRVDLGRVGRLGRVQGRESAPR